MRHAGNPYALLCHWLGFIANVAGHHLSPASRSLLQTSRIFAARCCRWLCGVRKACGVSAAASTIGFCCPDIRQHKRQSCPSGTVTTNLLYVIWRCWHVLFDLYGRTLMTAPASLRLWLMALLRSGKYRTIIQSGVCSARLVAT